MSFWQENYGFVREVYDYRCTKYQEWMDNIEAIIGKVMANTQYTAKEFKIIKDTFTSLCKDMDKENTKAWLDMMLEKLSAHSTEGEDGLSGRDKAMKIQEKKKLESMVERHTGLKMPTKEAQSKVAHYSECYAFGDDIHPVMKVLNEQRHLSSKEIHPHTLEMVEDQIDKQEKVLRTIENQATIYNDLMKRGAKLKANPNAPSFLEKEIDKMQNQWKETNAKAKLRLDMLHGSHKDWDVYEKHRLTIFEPLDALEEQFKSYKKIYDPKKGNDWLERKKKKAETLSKQVKDINAIVKQSFANIVALAGEDKREFMEKEVNEIDERARIVAKSEKTLNDLTDFNLRLTKMVEKMAEMRAWMMPATEKLNFITTTTDLSPEDRVKEIFDLQGQVNERLPPLGPLEEEAHALLDAKGEEDTPETHQSETAIKHMDECNIIKETILTLSERVETEAGSITEDQRHYADYLVGVKNFKPWMESAEKVSKTALVKPATLEDALKLLDEVKVFDGGCSENRDKLDTAVESRGKMEKVTKQDTEVDTLNTRYDTVKKIADDRLVKVQDLVSTWTELSALTTDLTKIICDISVATKPDVSTLEGIFSKFRLINDNKVKQLEVI